MRSAIAPRRHDEMKGHRGRSYATKISLEYEKVLLACCQEGIGDGGARATQPRVYGYFEVRGLYWMRLMRCGRMLYYVYA